MLPRATSAYPRVRAWAILQNLFYFFPFAKVWMHFCISYSNKHQFAREQTVGKRPVRWFRVPDTATLSRTQFAKPKWTKYSARPRAKVTIVPELIFESLSRFLIIRIMDEVRLMDADTSKSLISLDDQTSNGLIITRCSEANQRWDIGNTWQDKGYHSNDEYMQNGFDDFTYCITTLLISETKTGLNITRIYFVI